MAAPSSTAVPEAQEAPASVRREALPVRPAHAAPCIRRAASPVEHQWAHVPASASPAPEWADAPALGRVPVPEQAQASCLPQAMRRVLSALRPMRAVAASNTPRPKKAR